MKRYAAACCLVMTTTPAIAQIQFTDVTEASGLNTQSRLFQSVAWADYDDDGDVDLYITGRGANLLYRNNGDGSFDEVSAEARIDGPDTTDGDGIGVAFGDLDNDGDLDVFVSQINEGRDQLYRNEGPGGPSQEFVFTDIALEAGIDFPPSARGMTLVDYDRDGLLDIYVLASGRNEMFHNQGGWRFNEQGAAIGVDAAGRDVGAVATDVNLDGWVDLFVANRTDQPTNLYINRQGRFTDEATAAGIDAIGLGMGVVSFDYDNDLDFDLYWTTWPGDDPTPVPNRLYRNDGNLLFTDVTQVSGTADASGWGISANTADIDNDGWIDLFVTNGFDESTTPSLLMRNQGDGTFLDITDELTGIPEDARGVAFADYDADGDLDLLVTGAPPSAVKLWRNDTVNSNQWVKLLLRGGKGNHSAIGARVVVETDIRSTTQELHGSTGRGNQNDAQMHFGLGNANTVEAITVYWPSGQVQRVENLQINTSHTLYEPGTQPRHYSGAWYGGPGQSGHGFSIEALANGQFVIFWYAFDDMGQRTWLVSQGERRGNAMRGAAYTISGGQFPPDFDESTTERIEWGTLDIIFESCTQATASWTTDQAGYSDGSMSLTRLSAIAGMNCG